MAWYNDYINSNGKRSLHFKPTAFDLVRSRYGDLSVPCGKCIGCQTDKRNNWINRMMYEYSSCGCVGSFITLTYDDIHVPPVLSKSAVQKFMKRFRQVPRDYGICLPKFRYFFCGERGSRFGRPHYHGLIFGVDMLSPSWQPYLACFKHSYPVYTSHILDKIWPYGFTVIGNIDYASIRYVSKYIVKRFGQDDAFTLKSQGLGSDFFFQSRRVNRKVVRTMLPNAYDSFRQGMLHFPSRNGDARCVPIPKNFDRYIESCDSDFLEEIKARRLDFVLNASPQDIFARADWLVEINKDKPNERLYDENY